MIIFFSLLFFKIVYIEKYKSIIFKNKNYFYKAKSFKPVFLTPLYCKNPL
ncbi:hypothetical protein HMPREF3200_00892 [Anaerococcus tetradius]|uniref:Uncharacterized protein n=1 Tax=Anaerococcus tetradius TaxID=33036 RepID=A0A133KF76_9FIRM|nr:hypothetical protein HMPREF3200_00892 [Anaerococcus tetradius]